MVRRLSTISGHQAAKQRTRIRERDCYQCGMCKRGVAVGEIDHRISLDAGGSDDDSNLWLLCKPCHWQKTCTDMKWTIRSGVDTSGIPNDKSHHWNT